MNKSKKENTSIECPDELDLIDFITGQLPLPEHKTIINHLANCMDCCDRVVQMSHHLQNNPGKSLQQLHQEKDRLIDYWNKLEHLRILIDGEPRQLESKVQYDSNWDFEFQLINAGHYAIYYENEKLELDIHENDLVPQQPMAEAAASGSNIGTNSLDPTGTIEVSLVRTTIPQIPPLLRLRIHS